MVTPLSVVGISRYHRPAEAFTALRNDFVRNAQVSLRAFRVGAYVLSHADGFVQTQRQIARAVGLSVTTVRAALDDLRADRYLVSRRIREGGRWIGTAYAVSDVPFTEEELAALCPPGAESEGTESEHSESVPPKKTTPVRETMTSKNTSPSGGPAAADPPRAQEAAPMSTPDQPALFDLTPQPSPAEGQGDRRSPSQRIVAAYVDSHRAHHGTDPTKRDIGRVARDAAALLKQAAESELGRAATAMGKTVYANLGVQLKIVRKGGNRGYVKGYVNATGNSAEWERAAADTSEMVADDPELAAWLAGVA